MSNIKESDLNPTAKQFLRDMGCNELYGEIRDIDLVGVKDDIIYALELKTALNVKVLEQALDRKKYADYVYIGIPYKKGKIIYYSISPVYKLFLETHGIGLVALHVKQEYTNIEYYYYDILKHAELNDKNHSKKLLINDFNDMYKDMNGGMTSAERISPFTLMLDEVMDRLKWVKDGSTMYNKNDGFVTIDELLTMCKRPQKHYANPKASLTQVFNSFGSDKVEKKQINGRNYFRYKELV